LASDSLPKSLIFFAVNRKVPANDLVLLRQIEPLAPAGHWRIVDRKLAS